jgi:hypothetical protein
MEGGSALVETTDFNKLINATLGVIPHIEFILVNLNVVE